MEKKGLAIFDGIVCGKALVYNPYMPEDAVFQAEGNKEGPREGLGAYLLALDSARAELDGIIGAVAASEPEKAEIFQAHKLLAEDIAIGQQIRELIMGGKPVTQAVAAAYGMYIDLLSQSENAFSIERAADLADVRNRVLRCLEGKPEKNLSLLPEPCVVLARELLPSDIATIDRKNVRAIATELGGATSHMAILAKSYGIPTIICVEGLLSCAADGDDVIVDGAAGIVVLSPDASQMDGYRQRQEADLRQRQAARMYRDARAVTLDGAYIAIELNISSAGELCADEIAASDGVGLMRSEFLYMRSKDGPPDEETQFLEYKAAVLAFAGKPVVLRTLDIGGDKQLPYLALPKEENPALGRRALRLCLEEKEIFRTQLRAALRASSFGELWLMFPMVGTLEDFRAARRFVRMAMKELDAEGIPYDKDIPLGIMVEVPSIALMADQVAQEVDFASIGTNDLCQYLMAVDRQNTSVAAYYKSFHPAVFRLVRDVARQFIRYGKPLSICGEMGGSPAAAIAFIGLGIRMLSMGAASMAAVKQAITGMTMPEAQSIAATVCALETAGEAGRVLAEKAEALASRPAEEQRFASEEQRFAAKA